MCGGGGRSFFHWWRHKHSRWQEAWPVRAGAQKYHFSAAMQMSDVNPEMMVRWELACSTSLISLVILVQDQNIWSLDTKQMFSRSNVWKCQIHWRFFSASCLYLVFLFILPMSCGHLVAVSQMLTPVNVITWKASRNFYDERNWFDFLSVKLFFVSIVTPRQLGFICLYICLTVSEEPKMLWVDFNEIVRKCWKWNRS